MIAAERPDALLPTLGGQTGLNLAVALAERGVLDRYGVELIGAKLEAIQKAEDRELFKAAMQRIGLELPRSRLRALDRAGARGGPGGRLPGDHPPVVHARRHRAARSPGTPTSSKARSAGASSRARSARCWSRSR